MTEEQFKKVCELNAKLESFHDIKREVFGAKEARLSYVYSNAVSDNAVHSKFALKAIAQIINRHDKMIREEVDKEIRKLQEEINIL